MSFVLVSETAESVSDFVRALHAMGSTEMVLVGRLPHGLLVAPLGELAKADDPLATLPLLLSDLLGQLLSDRAEAAARAAKLDERVTDEENQ